MSFDYHAYLAGREWAVRREAVRKRSGNRCERTLEGHRCKNPQQAVHHLTYIRVGNEHLGDLLAICKKCHEWLSGKANSDPLVEQSRISELEPIGGAYRELRDFLCGHTAVHKIPSLVPLAFQNFKCQIFKCDGCGILLVDKTTQSALR